MTHRTPLARVPFPRVKGTKEQAAALQRALRELPLEAYPRVRSQAGERRVAAFRQRAVLEVIASHANGAGFSFLTVETIARESECGERTVYRALTALEASGHLERFFFRRTSDSYRLDRLPLAARRGQGPNIYRMGAALRARAGLREVEWTPDTPKRVPGPTSRLVAPPAREPCDHQGQPPKSENRGSPGLDLVAHPGMQGDQASNTSARGTPRTKNYRKPFSEEERLVLSTSTKAEALRNTSEIVAQLTLNEILVVIEAEALVAAGHATWVEPGWSA